MENGHDSNARMDRIERLLEQTTILTKHNAQDIEMLKSIAELHENRLSLRAADQDRLTRHMDELTVKMAETTDKLNGLIGYIDNQGRGKPTG